MSDLIHRAQRAAAIIADPSISGVQKLYGALESLSGLELSRGEAAFLADLHATLLELQQAIAECTPEGEGQAAVINDADLEPMLAKVDALSARAISLELDRIVAELDAGVDRLPVEAFEEAREHRELMTARLIEVLRAATAAARAGNAPEGNAHFFALFLLTEFRAAEAFPAMLEAFSLPGELPFELFEDAVTSTWARILALFAADRLDLIDGLIADQSLNEYVRWEGAQSYVYLIRDGRLSRGEAIERLTRHLRQAIDQSDQALAGGIICVLDSLAPAEAIDDIKEAFNRDLVELGLVNMHSVQESIAQGEARFRHTLEWCEPTGIEDSVEELRTWAAFNEKSPPARTTQPVRSPSLPHLPKEWAFPELEAASQLARVRPVGRNDPCPCGSGKKFKKCCSSRK